MTHTIQSLNLRKSIQTKLLNMWLISTIIYVK
jgi:hypothetical protein